MRHTTFIAILTFLFSASLHKGCENCRCYCSAYDVEELVLNDTIDLKYSTRYCNPEYEIRLGFDSIIESRCPSGAICVWEGNASVKFLIKQEGENDATITLNTYGGYLNDTLVNGIRYELINLLPYPEIDMEYSLDDYTLQVYISD